MLQYFFTLKGKNALQCIQVKPEIVSLIHIASMCGRTVVFL